MSEGTYDSNGHWVHTNPVLKPDEIICDFFDKHNADEKQWDALDRLRELQKDKERLDWLMEVMEALQEHLNRIQQENAELRKDKERLDFLLNHAYAIQLNPGDILSSREKIDKQMEESL